MFAGINKNDIVFYDIIMIYTMNQLELFQSFSHAFPDIDTALLIRQNPKKQLGYVHMHYMHSISRDIYSFHFVERKWSQLNETTQSCIRSWLFDY